MVELSNGKVGMIYEASPTNSWAEDVYKRQDQYEAAQLDGASAWQSFIHITVPHIRMVVGLLVVLRTIWVFNSFDIIYPVSYTHLQAQTERCGYPGNAHGLP